jgi:UDP-N-acetylmuramoyl-tripeptide--D-alanyl-D-alanine ligase
MMWTGQQIRHITGGVLLAGPEAVCHGVSTDTRTLEPGQLFVALAGDNFDGHAYVQDALMRGCCGCLVHEPVQADLDDRVLVTVSDTLRGLGELANAHLIETRTPVIAVTGSNGKTGTKELIAQALSAYGNVAKNPGNFNNLIGVPLAAFQVTKEHDYAVLEMGMNRPGEIARLAEIVMPRVGLVTSVAGAHLEGLGTIEDVARAKGELYQALSADAIAVVNTRDSWAASAAIGTRAQVVRVGERDGDVVCEAIRRKGIAGLSATLWISGKSYDLHLRALGRHEIWNAALAMGVIVGLGLDPQPGISALEQGACVPGRLQWTVEGDGVNVIDDSYNANPASTCAALETLVEVAGGARTIAVLGDMLELGPDAPALHQQVAQHAADLDVDLLFYAGAHPQLIREAFTTDEVVTADDCSELLPILQSTVQNGDWVLVKGSRGMRMERAVELLKSLAPREVG